MLKNKQTNKNRPGLKEKHDLHITHACKQARLHVFVCKPTYTHSETPAYGEREREREREREGGRQGEGGGGPGQDLTCGTGHKLLAKSYQCI